MAKIIFIVGEPGVGKSKLVDTAFGHLERNVIEHKHAGGPMRELLWAGSELIGCELGRREGKHPPGYPGTDAMSMSAIVGVDSWLRAGADGQGLILVEGTRLANKRFVDAARAGAHSLILANLHGPDAAAMRRALRGSKQDPQWLKGRQTAAKNFFELARRISNELTADVQAYQLDANTQALRMNAGLLQAWAGLAVTVS